MTDTTVAIADIEYFGTEVVNHHNTKALFDNTAKRSCTHYSSDSPELIQPRLTTEELAALLHVKPQTVRAGLCKSGHYLGMRPAVKLPNRRLLWDAKLAADVLSA